MYLIKQWSNRNKIQQVKELVNKFDVAFCFVHLIFSNVYLYNRVVSCFDFILSSSYHIV